MLRYGLKNILKNPKFYLSPFWGVAEKFPNQMGNYIEPWTVSLFIGISAFLGYFIPKP